MELMNDTEKITKALTLIEGNAHNDYWFFDNMIEQLILDRESMYVVLEKIIDGTLDKKFIKSMFPLMAKSTDWDDFRILLEIGVMDGELELSDIKSGRSRVRKRTK